GLNVSLGSVQPAQNVVVAGPELLGTEAHQHVTREPKDHGEMIPAGAFGTRIQAARANRAEGPLIENPGGNVDAVDVLLRNNITGKNSVHAPGSQTTLRVLRAGAEILNLFHPGRPGDVGRFATDKPADGAALRPFHRLLIERLGAGLKVDQKAALAGSGLFTACGDALTAGYIDCNGLGEIDVHARVHGRSRLLGMKIRRALNHHRIHLAVEDFLVTRKAGVTTCRFQLEFLTE